MQLERLPPPGTADRLRRIVWKFVWLVLFRPSPTPLFGWRRALLRLFGAKVGRGAHPYPSARVWAPWNLVMGVDSCLASESECYNVAVVTLGARAIVSQRAFLCTASHDVHESDFALVGAPIQLGDGAWVAAAAFVGPGVSLGRRAVLAACSVAVHDVPAGQIAAGNPARPKRERMDPEEQRIVK